MSVREASGRVVADRYRLVEVLGQGGVGQVWRARDELLGRDVAVKEVVFPESVSEADRATAEARVLREARAAAALPQSSVVTVYDLVREDTRGYIVMELMSACSVSELVERDGPMAVATVAAIGSQVVDVLQQAHRHGIIHRDVKPGNVMVLPDGTVKLADFGIAWIQDDSKITASGLILGSPAFMAPEQAQGLESTPATDMYGLGATMYYAVEGVPPFDKGQAIATLTSVMLDPPRRPKRAGALAPLMRALLAKDPGARPNADQVRTLLTPLVNSRPDQPAVQPIEIPATQTIQPPAAIKSEPPADEAEDGGAAASSTEDAEKDQVTEAPVGATRPRAALVFDDLEPWVPAAATSATASSSTRAPVQTNPPEPAGVPERIHAAMGVNWDRRPWWESTAATVAGVVLLAALAFGAIYFLSRLNNASGAKSHGNAARAAHQGKNGGRAHKPKAGAAPGVAAASPPVAGGVSSPAAPGAVPGTQAGTTSSASSVTGVVPAAGWVSYTEPSLGWSISYPTGWDPVVRDSHDIDFADPNGGRYLRVAWTTTPGADPAARWQAYSQSFGARYPNYRTIKITPNFTFKGWKASAWEYTYSSGGTMLHAIDLAMVNGTYGFALNFQTHDADWVASQPIFDAFKRSFTPPAG